MYCLGEGRARTWLRGEAWRQDGADGYAAEHKSRSPHSPKSVVTARIQRSWPSSSRGSGEGQNLHLTAGSLSIPGGAKDNDLGVGPLLLLLSHVTREFVRCDVRGLRTAHDRTERRGEWTFAVFVTCNNCLGEAAVPVNARRQLRPWILELLNCILPASASLSEERARPSSARLRHASTDGTAIEKLLGAEQNSSATRHR